MTRTMAGGNAAPAGLGARLGLPRPQRAARARPQVMRTPGRLLSTRVRAAEEEKAAEEEAPPKALYADEMEQEGMFKRNEMSKEQQAKLRAEYLGLGGSANTAMGGNYFLNIILAITGLAVMCAALGYI